MIARQLLFLFSALGAINGIFLAVYFFSRRPRCLADCMLGALQREIPRHKILLMPEATSLEKMRDRAAWLGELCKSRGYRYAHRLHIELYGNRRGT